MDSLSVLLAQQGCGMLDYLLTESNEIRFWWMILT